MTADQPTPLRPLSPIELYSSARHHLGIYRSVTVTCRYHAPRPRRRIDPGLLYPALGRVVSAQPMLQVGILHEDTNRARFCQLAELDLAEHVSFATLDCQSLRQYNDQLDAQQGWHHDQVWPDLAHRQPWRIAVVEPGAAAAAAAAGGGGGEGAVPQDIVFSYHHSLLDGTSGRLFHEHLVEELNQELRTRQGAGAADAVADPAPPATVVALPRQAPKLPEPQESMIGFSFSPVFLAKVLWNELAPAMLRAAKVIPWHAKPMDLALPYVTLTKPLDVPWPVAARLVKACREHGTSVTGLTHALTLASLAARLPAQEATSFAASTPIGLRPLLPGRGANPGAKDLLRVLVTSHAHEFSAALTAEVRRAASSPALDRAIWKVARRVKGELVDRLAAFPRNDVVGLMKYNSDWLGFFKKKHGQPREVSWEVSNIGVLRNQGGGGGGRGESAAAASPGFTVSRVYFTNGAMVTGAPVGLGVASAPGGCLTIALSWQEGVVSGELMKGLADDLAGYVDRFDKTGHFGPRDP
ncbi:uncharacterized protein UV8b_00061 [Ustilaginoidea virens]|uniref:Alcohol acetyltransferase n=1 Tax=Ustilaginoidea virens TaxID=1159556 RepID=A0A8E5HI36_USTVR|nr:uncharacterized protein UV8b_00061 [Ustilaginoidea virens]QUC15820.1 hypothetical protein UV8b_00061 [Ustilaginoidea virens]